MSGSEPPTAEEPAPPDGRLVPAAVSAWAGMWLASGGQSSALVALGVGGLVATAAAWWRRSWVVASVALVLLTSLVVGGSRSALLATSELAVLARQGAVVDAVLVVASEPRVYSNGVGRGESVWLRAEVVEVRGRGGAWGLRQLVTVQATGVIAAGWAGAEVGATVGLSGRMSPAEAGDGDAGLVRALTPAKLLKGPPAWLRAVENVREGLRQAMARAAPGDRAALVPALVVGDVSQLPPELTQDFRTTALTHLTAVSGANLTLLLVFVGSAARSIGVRGRWLTLVAVVSVVSFVALCRSEPSVVRAAAMGVVGLAALGRGGGAAGLRTLCVAVLALLLWDPWLSRSTGFTLSVVACSGIIWWGRRWANALARWLPRPIAEAFAVPMAAQVATQPVVTAISGQVSIVGLLANVLAGPLVGPATVLGLLTAAIAVVSQTLAVVPGWLAGWVAEGILQVAHRTASLPGAATAWPATPVGLVVLVAVCGVMGGTAGWLLKRPLVVGLCVVVVVVLLSRPPMQPGWPPTRWLVLACDVGQGDATLVRAGPGEAIVLDTGPDPAAMLRCMDQAGVRAVPLLVLTHFHADHIGGAELLLSSRRVGRVVVSPFRSPAAAAASVAAAAARVGVPFRDAVPGEVMTVGEARVETLSAGRVAGFEAPGDGESAGENDSSVLMRMTTGGVSVLVTGDLEPAGQQGALSTRRPLAADILKVPHHGSARQDGAFLAATGARLGIVSVGSRNDYGHPAAKTMRVLELLGVTVLRTDERGAIAFSRDGDRITITTQR